MQYLDVLRLKNNKLFVIHKSYPKNVDLKPVAYKYMVFRNNNKESPLQNLQKDYKNEKKTQ